MNNSSLRLPALAALAAAVSLAFAAPIAHADGKAYTADRDSSQRDSSQPVSDTWITTKVKSSLLVDGDVSGTDISVSTTNGVVTLTGTVDSKAEHDRAVAETRGIEGVVRVDHSGLIVSADRQARSGTMTGDTRTATSASATGTRMGATARDANDRDSNQPVTDTWITTKVKSTLLADSEIDGSDISVTTVDGVVTLTGVLESQAAVDKAIAETRAIDGVVRVDASELSARALSSR